MKKRTPTPRYRQKILMTIETSIGTDPQEVKAAVARSLGVTVVSCSVGEAEYVGP